MPETEKPQVGEIWRIKNDPSKTAEIIDVERHFVVLKSARFKDGTAGRSMDAFLSQYEPLARSPLEVVIHDLHALSLRLLKQNREDAEICHLAATWLTRLSRTA